MANAGKGERAVTRLEQLRRIVDDTLRAQVNWQRQHAGCIHLYGVAAIAAQLAERRGLDPILAAAAGLLHDIYTYRTGLSDLHAQNSAEEARPILRDCGLFSAAEQRLIWRSIFCHSDKQFHHGPYAEVLKDADVLQRYWHDPEEPVAKAVAERLQRALQGLGLSQGLVCDDSAQAVTAPAQTGIRPRLADLAERLANQPLVGNAGNSGPDVYPLIRYFPGATPGQGFDWCASFVYHCALQAGLRLPIKHQLVSCRFAAVPAWLEWAQLPEARFFHRPDEAGFVPERGDLVIFDQLVSDSPHDHIGVILNVDGAQVTTAEGNVKNRSGLFLRHRVQRVNGFIRIGDGYDYLACSMGTNVEDE